MPIKPKSTVPTEAAKPKCPTGHANVIGHEWSSTCQDCGEIWHHRIPEYVTSTGKFAETVIAKKGNRPMNSESETVEERAKEFAEKNWPRAKWLGSVVFPWEHMSHYAC